MEISISTGALYKAEFVEYIVRDKYDGLITIELDLDDPKKIEIKSRNQYIDILKKSINDLLEMTTIF